MEEPGGSRKSQEEHGGTRGARGSQEEPAVVRRTQEDPGGPRKSQEAREARKSQEDPGGARRTSQVATEDDLQGTRCGSTEDGCRDLCLFLGKCLGSFAHVMVPHICHDDARRLTR